MVILEPVMLIPDLSDGINDLLAGSMRLSAKHEVLVLVVLKRFNRLLVILMTVFS